MPSFRSALILALHLTAVFGYDYGSLNHDASPYVVAMFGNESVGPDGMLSPKPSSINSLTQMDATRTMVVYLSSSRFPGPTPPNATVNIANFAGDQRQRLS